MLRGLDIRGRGPSFEVVNNTITTSRGAGVRIRSGAGMVVKNNIISLCRWGIQNDGREDPVVSYNCMFDNQDDNYVDCSAGEGSIETDPRFADRRHDNFHLSWNSPCIDAGDPTSPRDPDGSRVEMGAFYFDKELTEPGDEFGIRNLEFGLAAAPNPFNDRMSLSFQMPAAGDVRVSVYDLSGRLLSVLADGEVEAGKTTLALDASGWPAGVYIATLRAGAEVRSMKIVKVN